MGNFLRNIHPLLSRGRDVRNYDGANYAILKAISDVLDTVESDTITSKKDSSLETATGDWLDEWGNWFGLPRKDGEEDEHYRARIIRYVLLKRGTIDAIKDALRDHFDDPEAKIDIYEPFRNIFYTNKSKLNGEDFLMGEYYRFAIIDITLDRPYDDSIGEVIQKFKPAGVKWMITIRPNGGKNFKEVQSPQGSRYIETYSSIATTMGLGYIEKVTLLPGDALGEVNTQDLFITNKSNLNSEDVLAGSHTHSRKYYNFVGFFTEDFKPSATETLHSLGTSGEELWEPYNTINTTDGRTVTLSGDKTLVASFNIKESLKAKYAKEYERIIGESPEATNAESYSRFLGESIVGITAKAPVPGGDTTKVKLDYFDFSTETWVTCDNYLVGRETAPYSSSLGYVQELINENGMLFIRLTPQEGSTINLDSLGIFSKVPLPNSTELVIESYGESNRKEVAVVYTNKPEGAKTKVVPYSTRNLIAKDNPGKVYISLKEDKPEFVNSPDWDIAPSLDKYGTSDISYELSFEIKGTKSGKKGKAYCQNGTGAKYGIDKPDEVVYFQTYLNWQRVTFTDLQFKLVDDTLPQSLLAFYADYGTDNQLSVKNVELRLSRPKYIGTYELSPGEEAPTDLSKYTYKPF